MGYQALLFCPDEKLARVVNQVFGELDFSIEAVIEPFAAVKKLMAQRYDAIVVDCENEQNASLLFKSARNSTFNHNSLAIALVEGQAGVAKAYRIGANLVLTKPINVEQAKGTLRVARGLLRKNSEAANPAASSAVATAPVATPIPATSPIQLTPIRIPATTPPVSRPEPPTFQAPLPPSNPVAIPAMTATIEETLAPVPHFAAEVKRPIAPEMAFETPSTVSAPVVTNETPRFVAAPVAPRTVSALPSVQGSAAAAAPAKEAAAALFESKPIESAPAKVLPAPVAHDRAAETTMMDAPMFGSMTSDAPSFSALGEEDSERAGGSKKMIFAGVAVLVLAILGYLGYENFGKTAVSTPAPTAVAVPQTTAEPAPTLAPMTTPVAPSTTAIPPSKSASSSLSAKGSGTIAIDRTSLVADSSTNRVAAPSVPELKSSASAPMVVKSNSNLTQAPVDESAPPLPGAVAATNDNRLAGLMSATTATPARPTLSTVRVSQGVSQGLVIKRVQPKYPQAALAVHAQGSVLIEATINKEGNVTNLKVVNGDPVLARAALDAVRQWRYKPYYLDGEPVEIQTQITVNFKAN